MMSLLHSNTITEIKLLLISWILLQNLIKILLYKIYKGGSAEGAWPPPQGNHNFNEKKWKVKH